jgi:phosphoribosyl 1,2-cyclic phosphodiesterase
LSSLPPAPGPEKSGDDVAAVISFCLLASGSKGNAIYVSDGETAVLFDAGLSGVQIERRMASCGLDPRDLAAIVVSHEHNDHIQGVGVLSRRYHLPVYISRDTEKAAYRLGNLRMARHFCCGTDFQLNRLQIHPFSIAHDAGDPAGFTISRDGVKIGIATDLGVATGMVRVHLRDCLALVLEANHDPQMLIEGPYPWPLKQRIQGRTGHLSNPDAMALLQELAHDGLQQVVLAHLSETNNTPEKALAAVAPALCGRATRLGVAHQDRCSRIFRIGKCTAGNR